MELLKTPQYLDSFVNFETISDWPDSAYFKLDRVYRLLELLGNPQKELRCIHVAGTKGKGSICAFVAHILQSSGYTVGLYTSPHFYELFERIRILDSRQVRGEDRCFPGKISGDDFYKILDYIKSSIEKVQREGALGALTYFEIVTVLALCYFRQQRVDFAVLEAGLGGRLDATNVVDSILCAIGPISLEHTKQLGSTIEEIAYEKAAIIKTNSQIVISAPQQEPAARIIKQRAKEVGAKSMFVGEDIFYEVIKHDIDGQVFNVIGLCFTNETEEANNWSSFLNGTAKNNHKSRSINKEKTDKGTAGEYRELETRLPGEHQAVNATVAVGIIESLQKLGFDIKDDSIQKGIKDAMWPGRFEVISKNPVVIVDGAQNAESIHAIAKTLWQIFPDKKVTLVLGISKDKDKTGICRELNPIVNKVIFTKSKHPRAYDFLQGDIEDLFADKKVINTVTVAEAMKAALAGAGEKDIILVTGSLFVVAEARLCINHD